MEKRTWRQKLLFVSVCCTYVLIMSASIYVLSQHSDQPNLPSYHNSQSALIQITKPYNLKKPLSLIDEKLINVSDLDLNDELQDEMEEFFEYNSEFMNSVRGKEAEKIFHPVITRAANEYDIDPALIKAIIWAESSFNPKAISTKGAVGLMQLMPSTAKSLGIKDILNPESNIYGGVKYFKQLLVRFKGDSKLALAAYNAGSQRVIEYNGIPPFETTQFYVNKVLEYYEAYKQFELKQVDQI